MTLPQINVSSLPDLHTLTGAFGSLAHPAHVTASSNDTIINLMVFLYDLMMQI